MFTAPLQPWILYAIPLVALPIVIHLINQRRYQTVRWGAMMFLLAANRLSRGYARLRQWLIMAFRMLAIAALIFAVSRPLASGWLGLSAGGRADTTIVLIDRSPSMQETGGGTGGSKLETGRQQLANALGILGSSHWVVIDSTTNQPIELESSAALLSARSGESSSSSSDIPAMLQAAHDYMKSNQTGRTEIWICSDSRENDWDSESGRWQSLRESFGEFPQGVRFRSISFANEAPDDMSIRVTGIRRLQTSDGAELLISLKITRATPADSRLEIPVQFEIEGARSELTVELEGLECELKDHRIPLERTHERGWGRVTIPADANPANNEFCFVFDKPVPRVAVIVADDPQSARPLELAAGISPDPSIPVSAEVVGEEQLTAVDWDNTSLLLWHSPLPKGNSAQLVTAFIERGGQAIFLPPRASSDTELFGMRWGNWVEAESEIPVESWRGDQDLLAHTNSGAALPVGKLQIKKYCEMIGDATNLATLRGDKPLFVRVPTTRGGVYFLATTPAPADSTMATDGVALYVLIQRAQAAGAVVLGNTRQFLAGEVSPKDAITWQRIIGDEKAISNEYAFHQGIYSAGEKLLAINRSAAEDQVRVVAEQRMKELFQGLDFTQVSEKAGSLSELIQEIWRLFLASMIIALIAEAILCLPKLASVTSPLATPGPVTGFQKA